MKHFVSFLCIMFAILFSLSAFTLASAADTTTPETEIITEEYAVINSKNCRITISGINADMSAVLTSKTSASLHITMELQKVKSGVYTTIETYTASGTGFNLNLNKTRLINALATYRLKVTFTAGGETAVVYAYP